MLASSIGVGAVLTSLFVVVSFVCVELDWWAFGVFLLSPCVIRTMLDNMLLDLDCLSVCWCFDLVCILCAVWFPEDVEAIVVMFDRGCLCAVHWFPVFDGVGFIAVCMFLLLAVLW